MKTANTITFGLTLAAVVAATPLPALADRGWTNGAGPHMSMAPHMWHGDIHRFRDHDFVAWRGGAWNHGFHDGRWGWWWVAGGLWYFYPRAVYPYPDPYTPSTVVVQQTAPAYSGLAPAQSWYYCESAKTYYPYVASCAEGWKAVPATPPGTATQ